MTKIIAVLGATGTQGGSVARTFLNIPGWRVHGITRRRDSPAAQKLEEQGVHLIEADLDDVDSLVAAFASAHVIFGVTDFWQFPKQPKTHAFAAAEGITWNEACYRFELQHGINVIDAAARHAAQHDFDRLVLSSLSDAQRASKGKYTWVYHFDSKAHFVQYLEKKASEEQEYANLFDKTSYVQMGNYLDNWNKNPIFTPKKQVDGSFVWQMVSTPEGNYPSPFVHPPTDTGPFVEALVLSNPPKTTMLGTSSLTPYSEYVRLWGDFHGVKAVIKTLSIEDLDKLVPGGQGREVGETIAYVSEFGWDGGEGAILPEEAGVDLKALTNVETYIRTTDWSSVLG